MEKMHFFSFFGQNNRVSGSIKSAFHPGGQISRRMHGYSTHPLLLFVGAFGGRSPLGYMHSPL
jgi:hypothetical protein